MLLNPLMNYLKYYAKPKKLCTSLVFFGVGHACTEETLSQLICNPS